MSFLGVSARSSSGLKEQERLLDLRTLRRLFGHVQTAFDLSSGTHVEYNQASTKFGDM